MACTDVLYTPNLMASMGRPGGYSVHLFPEQRKIDKFCISEWLRPVMCCTCTVVLQDIEGVVVTGTPAPVTSDGILAKLQGPSGGAGLGPNVFPT